MILKHCIDCGNIDDWRTHLRIIQLLFDWPIIGGSRLFCVVLTIGGLLLMMADLQCPLCVTFSKWRRYSGSNDVKAWHCGRPITYIPRLAPSNGLTTSWYCVARYTVLKWCCDGQKLTDPSSQCLTLTAIDGNQKADGEPVYSLLLVDHSDYAPAHYFQSVLLTLFSIAIFWWRDSIDSIVLIQWPRALILLLRPWYCYWLVTIPYYSDIGYCYYWWLPV